jgi:hypothetical protein
MSIPDEEQGASSSAEDSLDVAEMARRLGISERRVRTIAQLRGIGRTVGRLRFFEPADVERMQPREPGALSRLSSPKRS